jgi:Flp pilus assembly protein TadG
MRGSRGAVRRHGRAKVLGIESWGVGIMKKMAKNKEKGIATLELALILPILCILAFAVIDFGRLVQARLVVTNVSREGGSLASRDIKVGSDLLLMLQSSGSPLDLQTWGRMFVTRIKSGATQALPNPTIDTQFNSGALSISSVCGTKNSPNPNNLGLSPVLYNHLKFETAHQTADISEITVVEVYYKYRPITPLPNFIQNILLTNGDGIIIGSKSVF